MMLIWGVGECILIYGNPRRKPRSELFSVCWPMIDVSLIRVCRGSWQKNLPATAFARSGLVTWESCGKRTTGESERLIIMFECLPCLLYCFVAACAFPERFAFSKGHVSLTKISTRQIDILSFQLHDANAFTAFSRANEKYEEKRKNIKAQCFVWASHYKLCGTTLRCTPHKRKWEKKKLFVDLHYKVVATWPMKGMAVMIFGSDFEKNFLTPKVQRVLLNLAIQEKPL
jgi:hypothetical protein